jgi:short-subunit dehydrogenase
LALPPPATASTALVTGASSGIGADIARELVKRGQGVTLVARRTERLRELAAELEKGGVRAEVIGCDLAEPSERDRLQSEIEGLGLCVEVLVNNAGFGGGDDFAATERELLVEMVRVNVETVADLTARYLPGMVERGRGAILNVASTAAFQPLPGSGNYGATKAYVLSLSEALSAEVKGHGVTVTALCPGPVKTEFAEVAGVEAAEAKTPDVFWTPVEQVAAEAVSGLERGKRVVVPGLLNRAGAMGGQHAPRSLMLPLARRLWSAGARD